MLDTHGRKYVDPIINATAKRLVKLGIEANTITIFAFVIGILASVAVYFQNPWLGVLLLWLSGFFDTVDGAMARMTKPSEFGTVLDVTFDRIVEIGIFLALGLRYEEAAFPLLVLCCAIIISITIFLVVGAVAEKRGMKSFYYQAGVAERTEGFIMSSLMVLFPQYLVVLTYIYAFLVAFTALQRFVEAKKILS